MTTISCNFYLAICVLGTAMMVSAQQTAAPPASTKKQGAPQSSAPATGTQQSAKGSSGRNVTQEQATEANIQLMRQDIRAQRKKIIAASMPLTEEEATKFWPVYDRYIGETIKLNDTRYAMIKEYAQTYQSMTDAQATEFIKKWVAFDTDNTQLRLKYMPEFQKVISPQKTALFFQLDRRLTMMIEVQLSSQIPLIQP
jgi:hypothetical protein